MYVIAWPLWVTLTAVAAGLILLLVVANPYSPLVRRVIAKSALQQSARLWHVLFGVIGFGLILVGALFRPT